MRPQVLFSIAICITLVGGSPIETQETRNTTDDTPSPHTSESPGDSNAETTNSIITNDGNSEGKCLVGNVN